MAVRFAIIRLDGDADGHEPVHIVVELAIGADHIGPERPMRVGGIEAARHFALGEIAAEAEIRFLPAQGDRSAGRQPVAPFVIGAGGNGGRAARLLARKTVIGIVDGQAGDVAGHPGIHPMRTGLPLGDVDLIADVEDGARARLDGIFRQQRNLAGRDDQAVHVVGHDLLPGGGQVLTVREQTCLIRAGRKGIRRVRIGRAEQGETAVVVYFPPPVEHTGYVVVRQIVLIDGVVDEFEPEGFLPLWKSSLIASRTELRSAGTKLMPCPVRSAHNCWL